MLQKVDKFVEGEPRLFDDGGERSALEVPAMHRDRDANSRAILMLEDVVTAGHVMKKKAGALSARMTSRGLRAGRRGLMPHRRSP